MAKNDPSTPSLAYGRMTPRWALLRAVRGGTETMRAASTTYLPKYAAEDDTGYRDRLSRSFLTNILEEAIQNVISRPFSRPVALPDIQAPYADWAEDIDLQGNNVDTFLERVADDAFAAGVSYIFVDYPRVPAGATLADERSIGARPYWVHYAAEDVLACQSKVIAGRRVWTHVRLRSYESVMDGYEEKQVQTILELNRDDTSASPVVSWIKHQLGERSWEIVEAGTITLPEIPLVAIYSGKRIADGECKPPFLDLAYKNVEHWQSSSDQRNILTMGRFAMLAVAGSPAGLDADPNGNVTIGPRTILQTTDVQGKFYFVEPAGHAIQAGERDLANLEKQMRVMGLGPHLTETTGTVTATERAIDEARATSQVQRFALAVKDGAEVAWTYSVMWAKPGVVWDDALQAAPSVDINLDYGVTPEDAQNAAQLIALYTAGAISLETLWNELVRIGLLGPGFDAEVERAKIETQPPEMTGEGSGSGRQPADV